MLAPVRVVKQSAPFLMVAGLAILVLTNLGTAILAAIGIALSSVVKLNESSVRVTRRRALNTVWNMFGGYAAAMTLLCGVTILLSFLVAHPVFLGPIVFFTLATCWLPFVVGMFARKK